MEYIIYDRKNRILVCSTEHLGQAVRTITRYLSVRDDVNWKDLYPLELVHSVDRRSVQCWKAIYKAHEYHETIDIIMNHGIWKLEE